MRQLLLFTIEAVTYYPDERDEMPKPKTIV